MKTNRFWACLSLIGVLTSCQFTEEISFNPDGSGSVSLNFDGSELMSMAGDSLTGPDEKAVDSVIYFADVLREKKDSIATLSQEEQERLRSLEPYRMHMKSDPVAKEMLFSLSRDFGNVSEVQDAFNAFQKSGALDGAKGASANAPDFSEGTQVAYTFDTHRFTRRSIVTDSALFKKRLDSLDSGAMFLAGSTYTIKLHFPKRVKSASSEEATLSVDGKTLQREVDFLEYLRNPAILDLEVELED